MNSSDIKQIFLKDDILPLGKFETLPVTHTYDALPDSYPDVTCISGNMDFESLLKEYYVHTEIIGFNYVKPRLSAINPEVSEDILREVLGGVGFYKGSYQSYSLRKVGTNELEEWVLPETRRFFESLPVKTFRQQYAVAAPGWNTKLHRDHADFKIHGFRAMVPLSADVYMGYENSVGENVVYKLERGGMYFVNIAKMHRGFNESESTERVNLIMQMDTDELVFGSSVMKPIKSEELDALPHYAKQYTAWDFGYEL